MHRRFRTYWPYLLLTTLIMVPLWLPGYIFALDLAFTPTMPMPTAFAPDYLWELLLHGLSLVLPSSLLEKLILTSIPLIASVGMHRLLSTLGGPQASPDAQWRIAVYAGAALFAANPFTYSRFMAGQYAVLLGYAALPWFAWLLLQFVRAPSWRRGAGLGLLAAAIAIISVHTIGLLALLALAICIGGAITQPTVRKQLLTGVCIGSLVFAIASSYWLVPLVTGTGTTSTAIRSFDTNDAFAFATLGSSMIIKTINVLSLQGFWAEGRELYRLPQDQLPLWGTIRLVWWVVIGIGLVALYRRSRERFFVISGIGLVALALAVGAAQPLLTAVGYREPHKFAGLVALVLAITTAYGIATISTRSKRRGEWQAIATTAGLWLMVILLAAPMYGGFSGQLQARHYPPEWRSLNSWLNQQPQGAAIFVPWHQYLGLDFAGRIIANPAPHFFDRTIIISQDPELGNISTSASRKQLPITTALDPTTPQHPQLARVLAAQDVRYIIVSSSYQPGSYDYLQKDPTLKSVWHNRSLMVYLNTLYKE